MPGTRDARLPDQNSQLSSRRPYNVTPHVAVTTAAALNAERSAERLKKALARVRKEPLLNMQAAASTRAIPAVFNTPQKDPGRFSGLTFDTPLQIKGPLFPTTTGSDAANANGGGVSEVVPDWDLPEDNFNPATPLPTRRGAGAGTKRHGSVPLKRTSPAVGGWGEQGTTPTQPAPKASFDWGPLPNFNNKPVPTLKGAGAEVKVTPPKANEPPAAGFSWGPPKGGAAGDKGTPPPLPAAFAGWGKK